MRPRTLRCVAVRARQRRRHLSVPPPRDRHLQRTRVTLVGVLRTRGDRRRLAPPLARRRRRRSSARAAPPCSTAARRRSWCTAAARGPLADPYRCQAAPRGCSAARPHQAARAAARVLSGSREAPCPRAALPLVAAAAACPSSSRAQARTAWGRAPLPRPLRPPCSLRHRARGRSGPRPAARCYACCRRRRCRRRLRRRHRALPRTTLPGPASRRRRTRHES
mmetsp:Transcript_16828/g.58871  ORF Transcript_16828/g.58871 Transcript_16828/m.58871 type:complete len:222 (+) Transcript_16828:2419-3084(+)